MVRNRNSHPRSEARARMKVLVGNGMREESNKGVLLKINSSIT